MSRGAPPARGKQRARKTPAKTPARQKRPQPHGGALNTGNPGNRGGTGRPPDEHRDWCRQVVSDPACEGEVKAVLMDRFHPAFAAMWRELARRGYGMPAQDVTVNGSLQHEHTHRQVWTVGDREVAWN